MVDPEMKKRSTERFQLFVFITTMVFLLLIPSRLYAQTAHDIEILKADVAEAGSLAINPQTGMSELVLQVSDTQMVLELSENTDYIANWASLNRDTELMLFRGKIKGETEASWVRLAMTGNGMSGAYYDGEELHLISPLADLLDDLIGSGVLPDRTYPDGTLVVYRAADIRHTGLCALNDTNHNDLTGLNYSAFVDELADLASAAASKDINVAIVADTEYDSATGGNGLDNMLAEMNIVDGIFSEQVGLQLTVDSATVLSDNGNMTSTDAETLLGQLGVYANTQIGNPGLAHLFTGKDLNGSTVGIAYIGAACTVFGTGVTQRFGSVTALIAAHEFGHNMGSPHDNQAGSACASTPNGFLMNPSINGSSTFSACSVTQMQNYIQGASCIVDISGEPPVITSAPAELVIADEPYAYDNNNRLEASGTESITYLLDFGPAGMTVSPDGLVSWTPTVDQVGFQAVQITATNDFGSDSQSFEIEVLGTFINLNDFPPESYGQNQEGIGNVTVNDLGNQITLQGNRWQSIPFSYLVTADTILEFDFLSSQQGEIQGIGLDSDDALTPQRTFNLYGTQRWGVRSIRYTTPGEVQSFAIPVGQFFTGQMQNIFFANDHDIPSPTAHGQFSNVNLYENSSAEALNLLTFSLAGYGGNQDGDGTVEVLNGGTTLKMSGNRWQKIDLPVTITRDTILQFEFKSDALGEIHGIGLDKDLSLSSNLTFQFHGTQNWGIGNFTYTGAGEYQQFTIPVGNFYTGSTSVLFFVNDHDVASPTATSYFRNIIIR